MLLSLQMPSMREDPLGFVQECSVIAPAASHCWGTGRKGEISCSRDELIIS